MNIEFLNALVDAYVTALLAGFSTLHPYAFAILGLLGSLALMAALIPMIHSQDLGGILAVLLGMLFYLAFMVLLSTNLQDWALRFFRQFTEWGAAVSQGAFTAQDFMHPGGFLAMGFKVAWPIVLLLKQMGVVAATLNFGITLLYAVAVVIILATFAYAIKDVIMTIIEFYLALMASPVLIPWGVLTYTSFFFDFGVSWLLSTCIRMFLTTVVLGIGIPLFTGLNIQLTPGGDASLYSSWVMAIAAFIFACLVHQVASRSSAVGGRGMALAIPGSALIPPNVASLAMSTVAGAWASVGRAAIRGASRMLNARRGATS